MQATEFRKLVNRIVDSIKAKELRDFLSFIPQPNDSAFSRTLHNQFSDLVIGAMEALSKLNDDPLTAEVIGTMKLNEALNRTTIGRMIAIFQNSNSKIQLQQNHRDEMALFYALYASLDNFITLQNLVNNFLAHEETVSPSIVELRLFDFDNSGISAEDLSRCIKAFKTVVESLQRVYNIPGETRIVAMESGSDMTIWAQVGPIVDSVNKFFKDTWQLIVFNKINKFDRKIESIAKTVTVIADIEKQVETNAIDRDAAEALKKALLDGAKEMFDCQMFPANANVEEIGNGRKLLQSRKETLLLTDGKEEEITGNNT